jgi:hypothetical protein
MWKNVGDVDGGADGLRARQIKEDIKGLRDATEDVKRYADLVVAHNAREKPAPVAFSVISSATDEIVRIAKRYTATLTGASMLSFAPVDQFNWYDVFHFPWITPSEAQRLQHKPRRRPSLRLQLEIGSRVNAGVAFA